MNRKLISAVLMTCILLSTAACSNTSGNRGTTSSEVSQEAKISETEKQTVRPKTSVEATTAAETTKATETTTAAETTAATTPALFTDEQALTAITNYLNDEYGLDEYTGDAPCYYDIDEERTDNDTAVVYWRSYTGAFMYFSIDRVSGETKVMEADPGSDTITETGEKFNAKDYLNKA